MSAAPRRGRRLPRRSGRQALVTLAACTLLAAGCSTGTEPTVVTAEFSDVIDLVENSAVKIADVDVGTVDTIELTDDNQALVTMTVSGQHQLPANVAAHLRKTNVLGERYVALIPDTATGGSFDAERTITDTVVVPEFEEVIGSGTELIAAIAADTLAGAIEAGATGLDDGRGQTLGTLLDDLQTTVGAYDENSGDIVALLDGLDAFLAEAAPQAELHGRAVEELARFAQVLAEEDDHLVDSLVSVTDLADSGTDLIVTHRQRMDDFFVRFEALTGELVQPESELDALFPTFARHNRNVIRGVNAEFAQVILDIIVCGVNDEPGDQLRTCDTPPSARPVPQPRPPQEY